MTAQIPKNPGLQKYDQISVTVFWKCNCHCVEKSTLKFEKKIANLCGRLE